MARSAAGPITDGEALSFDHCLSLEAMAYPFRLLSSGIEEITVMDGISDIALREAARQALHDINGAMALLLFGSRARGDAKPDSDWDIAVVTDGSDRDWVRRGTVRFPPRPAAFDELPGEINVLAIPFETLRAKRNAAGHMAVAIARESQPLAGDLPHLGVLERRPRMRPEELTEKFGGIRRIVRSLGSDAANAASPDASENELVDFGRTLAVDSSDAAELFVKMAIQRRVGKHLRGHDLQILADRLEKHDSDGRLNDLVTLVRGLNGDTQKHHQGIYDSTEITAEDIALACERLRLLLPALLSELEDAALTPDLAAAAEDAMTEYRDICRKVLDRFTDGIREVPQGSGEMATVAIDALSDIRSALASVVGQPDNP